MSAVATRARSRRGPATTPTRRANTGRPPRLLIVAGALTAVVALIPLVYLVVRVSEAGLARIIEVLVRPRTLETVFTSVSLVLVVVTACLLIGIPTAWLVARSALPLRGMWLVLVALPLAIPSYVAAYAWLAQFPAMHGFWAAALILTLVSSPYIVLPVTAAFRASDPALEEVARSLGRGPFRAFATTTLPQAWPAAAGGALLVALYVLSDFGAVALLASYLKSLNFKDKVYVIGSPAIGHELDMQNIRHIGIGSNTKQIPDPAAFDYMNSLELDSEVKCVTVGFDIHFNYPKIVTATSYAHKNPECLFIATNDDAQFPTESTKVVIPGTGTFVNALRTSIGRVPVILGKPHRTMWEVLHNLHGLDPNRTCMVGDRLDTDIAFAANCSLAFSLAVLSGVTSEDEIKEHARYIEANDLGNEKAKCVPDFYARSLGELEEFIREHSD